jgi:hypothetical protein
MRIHFSSQGYRDFGKRYAEKVMEVLGDKLNPVSTTPSSSSVEESSNSAEPESSSNVLSSSSEVGPASSTIAIDIVTGVSSRIGKAAVNAGRVTVPVRLNGGKAVAKVYSMLGKEVLDFSHAYDGTSLGFNASSLPQGSYMLSVQVGSEHSVQKVLVK